MARFSKIVFWQSLSILLLCVPAESRAQQLPSTGPVIKNFGRVYEVPSVGLPAPAGAIYKVLFDVAGSPSDENQVNPELDTVARFLNMHARAGVPVENLKVAIVIHGSASKDVLRNSAYRSRYGVDNPNAELLDALAEAGVKAYLCGQTATSKQITSGELARPAQMALSAMTALVLLQDSGYRLIPW